MGQRLNILQGKQRVDKLLCLGVTSLLCTVMDLGP